MISTLSDEKAIGFSLNNALVVAQVFEKAQNHDIDSNGFRFPNNYKS
jgi:hypothetical protein